MRHGNFQPATIKQRVIVFGIADSGRAAEWNAGAGQGMAQARGFIDAARQHQNGVLVEDHVQIQMRRVHSFRDLAAVFRPGIQNDAAFGQRGDTPAAQFPEEAVRQRLGQ